MDILAHIIKTFLSSFCNGHRGVKYLKTCECEKGKRGGGGGRG